MTTPEFPFKVEVPPRPTKVSVPAPVELTVASLTTKPTNEPAVELPRSASSSRLPLTTLTTAPVSTMMLRAPAATLPVTVSVPLPPVETSSLIVTVRSADSVMFPLVLDTPLSWLTVRSLVVPVAVSVMLPAVVEIPSATTIEALLVMLIAPDTPVTSNPLSEPVTLPTVNTNPAFCRTIPPVPVVASTFETAMSMSSATPTPVAALNATPDAVMLAVSKAVMSVMLPPVAVTLTVLDVVVIWPSTTFVAASSVTSPLPVE